MLGSGDGVSGVNGGERPSRIGLAATVVVWAAVLARVLTLTTDTGLRLWYAAGLSAFLVILIIVLWRRPLSTGLLHVAFALQSAIVLLLLALNPERDFLTTLFVLQCYQAAIVFTGRTRLVWVALLVTLIGASLALQLGLLRGLALALVPMAAGVVLSTYVIVNRELEAARATSERMVADLQVAQQQLKRYASQVDELVSIEERSKLARELQESVSQTLSAILSVTGAAGEVLDHPDRAGGQLEHLQALTQQALAQMRAIISELRPAAPDVAADAASDD